MRERTIGIAYDCLFPFTTGGGERLYRSYASQMAERGLAVEYLTAVQWPTSTPPEQSEMRVVPVVGRLQLYDEGGVRRTPAALLYASGLFRSLLSRRRNYRAVVVGGLPVLNVFAARAALIGSGTHVVIDYLEVWGRRQWVDYAGTVTGSIAWMLQKLAIKITPIATCHSQLTAAQLRKEGFRGRLLVSPGLIDGDSGTAFSPSASSPPFVLYAGRHIPDKRVEALPAAVARARQDIPELRLVVLGTGPSSREVDRSIDDAGARAWTEQPGFVDEYRLTELFTDAAVLVNPSRREGYGLVVVEASAHGTPVVLVADPGNAATELIEAGVNGFIAQSATPEDLGTAIVDAVKGGEALRSLTRSWYEEALRTRTVERTVDALLAAIGVPTQASPAADPPSGDTPEGPL